jgi:hypothetical protein
VSDALWYELSRAYSETMDEAGRSALAALGEADNAWLMPAKAATDFLESRQPWADELAGEAFERMKYEMQQGFAAGEGVSKLADRVAAAFDHVITPARAATIAHTEAGMANSTAAHQAYQQIDQDSPGVWGKKWLTSGLPNTRPSHLQAAADSKAGIPLDEEYSNGLMHPHDPDADPEEICNCRCTERIVRLADALKEAA